jgi:NAD(P)-dependent dehydrogenase (short-subunit alcohol dehydrogenase family)
MERTGLPRTALAGQVAVVTGAGRGIGRQAARALAWLGAKVVIAELSEESGREAEQIIRQDDGEALFVHTDVSNEESVQALADETRAAYGPATILVNNAILCPVAAVVEMEAALWQRVMAVNLGGTFLTCRVFLPDMLAFRRGVIVNMISTEAMPGLSAYMASKQGITGFSQSLAAEVTEHGVRVIPFAPGMVDTPAIREAAPQLALHLGMTPEQFLGISLHPAYPGLMPAEHAGAATAYLVAALAEEYQGEVADGYAVLERAGIIAPPRLPAQVQDGSVGIAAGNLQAIQSAIQDCLRLQEMIAQTEAEFNRLPVFVRPLARSGFKNKSGQSLADWSRTAAELAGRLGQVGAGDGAALAALRAELPRLKGQIEKLISYYQGVPVETARFTKDAEMLRQVSAIASERTGLLRSLAAALEAAS